MFYFKSPSSEQINQFISTAATKQFSYPNPGTTKNSTPLPHYKLDHNRTLLGHGADCFTSAQEKIKRWQMFGIPWLKLRWPNAPIEIDTTVAVQVTTFGMTILNSARIVYTINEQNEQLSRFGFAYGTLPDHVERGEERFSVEWHHTDDSVWYDIYALSKPNLTIVKIGYPYARWRQKQFARDSLSAMKLDSAS